MTAASCPCGETGFTDIGTYSTTRICVECGAIADRCAEPGCDSFGDHMDDDGGEWCAEHCPDPECVAERDETEVAV